MLLRLAFRNVVRNLHRLLPMIVTLVVAFMLMLLGNAVLSYSRASLFSTFAGTVAGDLSVSSAPEGSQFTIFGSDALLVGDFLVPPTMVGFDELDDHVASHPAVASSSPVVTAVARMELAGSRGNHTVLGIDFDRHAAAFPELELVAGRWPETGERALVVQDRGQGAAVLGRSAVLTIAHDLSFTIREVPVAGVFRFPVDDDLLDRVVFADADTARSLNGYVFGAGGVVDLPEADRQALEQDFDDLFGEGDDFGDAGFEDNGFRDGDDWADDDSDPGVDRFAELDAFFESSEQAARDERATVSGAWNFLLIRLADPSRASELRRSLIEAGFSDATGYQIRDWQATVGGTAQLVWFLQILFNAGVVFVAIGAALVTTNALVLSVLERTAEIGSMRALGATRLRVSGLLCAESIMVVLGSAVLGLALGFASTAALNAAGLVTGNQYLAILFGGEPVQGTVSAGLLLLHGLAALLLAGGAVVYPLARAFAIQPVEAMRS